MLTEYFTRKIGETLYRTVTGGDRSVYKTYARAYKAEVLTVTEKKPIGIIVNVQSHDLCPNGCVAGDTDAYLGDYWIPLWEIGDSLETFWDILVHKCDPTYADHFEKGTIR